LNTGEENESVEDKREFPHFNSEEEFKALPEFTIKDKYGYLKGKISEVIAEKEQLETELAKAKIRWADMELQKDNLETRLN